MQEVFIVFLQLIEEKRIQFLRTHTNCTFFILGNQLMRFFNVYRRSKKEIVTTGNQPNSLFSLFDSRFLSKRF